MDYVWSDLIGRDNMLNDETQGIQELQLSEALS
jgi:hypothetical protein